MTEFSVARLNFLSDYVFTLWFLKWGLEGRSSTPIPLSDLLDSFKVDLTQRAVLVHAWNTSLTCERSRRPDGRPLAADCGCGSVSHIWLHDELQKRRVRCSFWLDYRPRFEIVGGPPRYRTPPDLLMYSRSIPETRSIPHPVNVTFNTVLKYSWGLSPVLGTFFVGHTFQKSIGLFSFVWKEKELATVFFLSLTIPIFCIVDWNDRIKVHCLFSLWLNFSYLRQVQRLNWMDFVSISCNIRPSSADSPDGSLKLIKQERWNVHSPQFKMTMKRITTRQNLNSQLERKRKETLGNYCIRQRRRQTKPLTAVDIIH